MAIEGKFGQAKRRFPLARVIPKLAQTAQCAIAITFLLLNLERWLRQLLSLLFGLYWVGLKALQRFFEGHEVHNLRIDEVTTSIDSRKNYTLAMPLLTIAESNT